MKANVLRTLRNLHNDESGQDLVEYALVAALIAFGSVAAMSALASNLSTAFSNMASKMASASS
jgi:pilus assembly protein Flp/PilA